MDMPSPDDIKRQLEEAKKMLTDMTVSMAELKGQREAVRGEIKEHYKVISELESKERTIEQKAWEFKKQMQELENSMKAQEKSLAVAEENERAKAEFLRLSAQFDEAISAFSWGKAIKPYQVEGAKKLAIARRAVLGDKRGLGKTLTAIAFADLVGARKILVIVPNDIMGNFDREVKFWAPHRPVHIIGGLPKIQRQALLGVFSKVDDIMVIINYEAWRKDTALLDALIGVKFDTMICDEAHVIKEMSTNAFRGVKTIAHGVNQCPICGSDDLKTDHYVQYKGYTTKCNMCDHVQTEFGEFCSVKNFVPMTGTPILNKPQDIFPLLHLVNPTVFSDQRNFLNMYCEQDWNTGKWRFFPGGEERLATKISGMYIARDRYKAGVEIPKQTVQIYELDFDKEMYPKQYEAYQILAKKSALIVDDMLAGKDDDGDGKAVMNIAAMIALITRQRQMMTWPKGIKFFHPKTKQLLFECEVEESIKLDRIIDRSGEGLIPEFVNAEQERVVVFSQFKQPLIELERRIKAAGISVVRYDGDTSRELANEIQVDFDRKYQSADKPYRWDVVLANYKKGGVGLNLNAATQMIILDEEWNPGKEDQAYGRIDRLGQSEETGVHVLRVKDTVDMWLAKLIETKREMIAGFETNVDLQQELMDILRGLK